MRRFLGAALAVVVLGGGIWGFWLEPASLRNEDHALTLAGWPARCDGTRVAVLADLHVGAPHIGLERLAEIIALTRAASPDLILLAGDYVIQGVIGGSFVPPEQTAKLLGTLVDAPMGVHAVLGNHDWWFDGPRVIAALETAGISVLEDTSTRVDVNGCRFWLAGVSDYWERAHDVDAALRNVPSDAPTLLFTHNPDIFPAVPQRVILTIAGHTHGGQVFIPGVGRPIVPSEFGERYAVGTIAEDGHQLFVSSGIGTSILPVRFLVPPEVSVLELRGTNEDDAHAL